MAVDANVIIYARISEEITAGTTVTGAIKAGFHKAMSAIVDGNVTTLIAAAVLGALGSGSIRGFAITLALGVVLSMFTALVISKLLVNAVYAVGVQNPKYWSRMKQAPHIRFVQNRKKFFLIGACCILLGFAAMFRDITSVLQDADGLHLAIDEMQKKLEGCDVDIIAGTESRGFIFGMPIAYNLHKPFVLIRKKGKLPCETVSQTYDLEYGEATIEMHKDSVKPGQKVAIIDDLIATGGTVEAAAKLVEKLGGEVVRMVFLIELAGLKGRERLSSYDVESVISYPGN